LVDLTEMTVGRPGRPASLYAKPVVTKQI